jgi:Matrixin
LAHALDMWSRASDGQLRFDDVTDMNTTADMDMFFARWDHGDHEPFDGKGGIVAHSGYPMEGKVHFDASELWTINGKNGIDLRYVSDYPKMELVYKV